jgi:hypothetical protein
VASDPQTIERPKQRRPNGQLLPGVSGNPLGASHGRVQRAKLLAEITAELGGDEVLSGSDRKLLVKAIDLLVRKPPNWRSAAYLVSTANRIIGGLRRRYCKHEQPVTSNPRRSLTTAAKRFGEAAS